jgi:hypothetical protein
VRVDWSVVEDFNDPRIAYTTFHTKFKEIYFKKSKIKRGGIHKPWLSKGLLKSIKRKNVLYRQYVSNPTYNRECFYKSYRNRLNHSLRLAKRLYYNEARDKSKSNLKRTWKILNEVINRKKKSLKLPSMFKIDNQEISDPSVIADKFCSYFSNSYRL